MPHFQHFTQPDLQAYTSHRPHEVKLGQQLRVGQAGFDGSRYVLIGLPEDIGVRANCGLGGTPSAWPAFLPAFLNIQSTNEFPGDDICLLGQLDVTDLHIKQETDIQGLRRKVALIDKAVAPLIRHVVANHKIPIVIGGGHNNAYPIIKGVAEGYPGIISIPTPSINVINLDAHADFRPKEGRHSGNGFRYAFEEGYLDRYAIIGLHRNYNANRMMEKMQHEARITFSFWEDIFLNEAVSFSDALHQAFQFTSSGICGVELDLDAVKGVLSSARTPSGISVLQARQYLHRAALLTNAVYLHICEGAVQLANGMQDPSVGKLIAYLVSDFIRAHRQRNIG